jgi:Uncharacterized conserved protein
VSLVTQIEEEVKDAMRARDNRAPRRAAPDPLEPQVGGEGPAAPLSEDEELQVLQRERKKRNEAADAFHAAGRTEQAAKEEGELEILGEFMPEPLGEEDLERIVDDAIAENKATSMRDMGRVMADVMPQIAGARRSAVSQLVREKLA